VQKHQTQGGQYHGEAPLLNFKRNAILVIIALMADDDEDDCLFVESAFQEMDIAHDLRFVGDGRELLDYLYNNGDFADPEKYPKPNLILLDLHSSRRP